MKWLSGKQKKHKILTLFAALVLAVIVAGPASAADKINIAWGGSTPGGRQTGPRKM